MPEFVKTASDEKKWARAKEKAEGQDLKGDRKWRLVNHIYQKMKKGND